MQDTYFHESFLDGVGRVETQFLRFMAFDKVPRQHFPFFFILKLSLQKSEIIISSKRLSYHKQYNNFHFLNIFNIYM
jgi:hypothetical protein